MLTSGAGLFGRRVLEGRFGHTPAAGPEFFVRYNTVVFSARRTGAGVIFMAFELPEAAIADDVLGQQRIKQARARGLSRAVVASFSLSSSSRTRS